MPPLIAAFGISAVVPPVLLILGLVGVDGVALRSIAFFVSMLAVVGLLVASARLWIRDRESSS